MIKIGISGPFTGPRSFYGGLLKNTVESCFSPIRESVELVYCDDQALPDKALDAANHFITTGVSAVIGHFNSACAKAVKPLYEKNGIAFVLPASTNTELTEEPSIGCFRMCPNDSEQVSSIKQYLESLNINEVLNIYDETAYGKSIAEDFDKSYSGSLNVTTIELDNISEQNLASCSNIIFSGTHFNSANLLNRLRVVNKSSYFIASDDSHIQEFLDLLDHKPERTAVIGLPQGFEDSIKDSSEFIINNIISKVSDKDFIPELWKSNVFKFNPNGQRLDVNWDVFEVTEAGFSSNGGHLDAL